MLMRALDRLEEIIIATLMAAATVIIFFAVLHRYGLGAIADLAGWARQNEMDGLSKTARGIFGSLRQVSFTWAQELCIYLFVWMAKFGAAYGVRTGIHVGVDVLINLLGGDGKRRVVLFSLLCGALFTAVVGTLGAVFVWEIGHTEQTSADLELPMWIVYLAVPAGSYLMSFRFLQVAWRFAHGEALPHHDESHVEGVEEPVLIEPAPLPGTMQGVVR
jgi:TRAP-type C4-dicarboxylate transport system permease small subunit